MLKLNIGLSQKIGQANFGSRGASVNLEVELESNLVAQPERLHEQIQHLFGLARAAVEEELNPNGAPDGRRTVSGDSEGQCNGNHRARNGRPATQSQVRAINAIAHRQNVNLTELLRGRYKIDRAEDLALKEASELIDELKAAANGKGARR
jgi:hypothetical protein